ncbi:hypothetical protein V6A89_003790 [Enterobacter hormaechei]
MLEVYCKNMHILVIRPRLDMFCPIKPIGQMFHRIDLIEGLLFMKIKVISFTLLMLLSFSGMAAFNQSESKQLSDINSRSNNKVTDALKELDKAEMGQVDNNPEMKKQISDLRASWDVMINNKCELETFQSNGTDAKTADFNQCLVKEYLKEAEYFNSMLP